MNTRLALTLVSTLLNGALAVAIFLCLKKSAPTPALTEAIGSIPVSEAPPLSGMGSNLTSSAVRFHWSQVADENLKIYCDNLLAIGCPETTSREIILAVINQRFGSRRREIIEAFQPHYWEMVLRGRLVARQELEQTDWGKNLAALATERQREIGDVLGSDWLEPEIANRRHREERQQKRAWLAPGKRSQLSALEESHEEDLARWAAALGSNPPGEDEQARLQALEKKFVEAKASLLSPDELKELELRESGAANWAAGLPSFAPTEAEWRSLTALRADFEKSQNELARASLTDEERQARLDEAQSRMDAIMETALGEDRFDQLQLANNDDYQAARNVTQRYGLTDGVASESSQAMQKARQSSGQIRSDTTLSAEAQQAALNEIRQETENTLAQIMGAKAFSSYEEYYGSWLEDLNRKVP